MRSPRLCRVDLSGIASVAALAGIPAALLAARWQTKAALAQAKTTAQGALDQSRRSAQRAAYARLITEATAFRREAWHERGTVRTFSSPAPLPMSARSTFEALAVVRLEAPDALLPLIEQINVQTVALNRLMTRGTVDASEEDELLEVVGADIKQVCRGLRDALNDFTEAARVSLRAVEPL